MKTDNKKLVGIVGAVAASALLIVVPEYEGTVFEPYFDIVGVKTVCTGSTENIEDKTYTPEECGERLASELAEHAEGAMQCLTRPTTPGERVAYVSLAFNIGVSAFCKSTLARIHNSGRSACAELAKWDKGMIGGKLVPILGLTKRRAQERAYCEGRRKL